MKARIVSVLATTPTNGAEGRGRISFTIVGEIECSEWFGDPHDQLPAKRNNDDYALEYLTWKGTILKRTVPFLCVGDN